MSDNHAHQGISRRSFLKTTAAVAGVSALASGTTMSALAQDYNPGQKATEGEQLYHCVCRPNCFGFCNINVHVRDGKVVKTSKCELPTRTEYNRICHRGLTHVERIYSAGRLQYPLRRVEGTERGAGQWERITWEEAINEIASTIESLQKQWGPQSIAFYRATGNYGTVNANMGSRFVNAINATTVGPCNDLAPYLGQARLMGTGNDINEICDMPHAKTIVTHASNVTDAQVHHWHFIKEAKQGGTKLVVIDPVFTVLASKADWWIPIRPGTDQLLYWATMNIIVERDAVDYDFMSKRTVAPFLVRQDNGQFLRKSFVDSDGKVDGPSAVGVNTADGGDVSADTLIQLSAAVSPEEDPYMVLNAGTLTDMFSTETPDLEGEIEVAGVKCRTAYSMLLDTIKKYTPETVAPQVGLSVEQIERFADVCLDGPVYHLTGYGAGNQVGGVQNQIAGTIMACLSGNWGKPGATFGASYPMCPLINFAFPIVNPNATSGAIQEVDLDYAVAGGEFGGVDYPIKMLYIYAGNPVSMSPNANKYTDVIFPAMDLVVVADTVMTDTASYADIVLPAAQHFELLDWADCGCQYSIGLSEKAIDPPYEAKSDADIFRLLADKLGVGDLMNLTDEEVCKQVLETPFTTAMGITWDALKEKKYLRWVGEDDYLAYPEGTPFATTSGRVEFYVENPGQRAASTRVPTEEEVAAERMPHFAPPKEIWEKSEKYPLSIISLRGRYRVHSQYFSVSMLNELDSEPLMYVNPADAEARGIADQSYAEAFNDRGHCVAKVVYSQGIQKGTIMYPKGFQAAQHKAGSWSELLHGEYDIFAVANNFQDSACDIRPWAEGSVK